LTAAGFDWQLWNQSVDFNRTPPAASASLADRVHWTLALGPSTDGSGGGGGELSAFSMGASYSEESEGSAYIPGMMGHEAKRPNLKQVPFAFGDYFSATAFWPSTMPVSADHAQPLVIWLHPYSYNTGYAPSYGQAEAWADIAAAGLAFLSIIVNCFPSLGFKSRWCCWRTLHPHLLKVGAHGWVQTRAHLLSALNAGTWAGPNTRTPLSWFKAPYFLLRL
jgi:hypothetical protein